MLLISLRMENYEAQEHPNAYSEKSLTLIIFKLKKFFKKFKHISIYIL